MTISLGEYWDLLDRFDWYYSFSDCYATWKAGVAREEELVDMAKTSPEHLKLLKDFKAHVHDTITRQGSGRKQAVNKPPRPSPDPDSMKVGTLSNGLRVGNWSSPHPFTFVDGSVIPACSPERARQMAMNITEMDMAGYDDRWTDICLLVEIPDDVVDDLVACHRRTDVDIVIVPLMVLSALRRWNNEVIQDVFRRRSLKATKFRTIRIADRVEKKSHIDKFCI